jgi:hypothetical protein
MKGMDRAAMTSTQGNQLVEKIIQNDHDLVDPLLTLLYVFRDSRGDPLGEAMMQDVIRSLAAKSDRLEQCVKEVVAECIAELEESGKSIAAA